MRAKEIVGPIDGGCQCGAVRYRLDGKLYTVAVCHCTMCQRQSGSAFGMSLALYGGITMKNGAIEQENFRGGGRIVRMGEAPRRTWVDLVESNAPPGGVGEPGVPPVAPAIANAILALSGKRVRELPLIKAIQA